MAYSQQFPVDAKQVMVVGTGGESREKAEYENGAATGMPERYSSGAAICRLSGVAVSVGGAGLDGVAVTTTTPMETVPAGTVFRASGDVVLTMRANARLVGRGDQARALGDLQASIFIETLEPVGDLSELLSKTPAPAAKPESKASESRAS